MSMFKNDGTSRWAGFSQNKKMTNFNTKETTKQPPAISAKEDEIESQQLEIVDDYSFEENSQEVNFDFTEEPTVTVGSDTELAQIKKQNDETDHSENLKVHGYSNNANQEQLEEISSEVKEVVESPLLAEKQEVKIVVADSYQATPETAEQVAPESIADLRKEQAVAPEQMVKPEQPEEKPEEKPVVVVGKIAIRLMQELNAKMDKIESTYISRNFVEKQQEEIINSMHRELVEYKEDAHKEHLKPFVKGIIAIINSQYKRMRELTKQGGSENPAIDLIIEELKIVIEDLENLLYPYEIDRLNVKKGDVYNADIHKTLKRVMTSNKEQDRTISSVFGFGYQWGSRIIEKASVITFVYEGKEQGGE